MGIFRIDVMMHAGIHILYVETEEEALSVYKTLKSSIDNYDDFPLRNKENNKTVEIVFSHGNKSSFKIVNLQSVTFMPCDNPTWFDDFLIGQQKYERRIKRQVEGE